MSDQPPPRQSANPPATMDYFQHHAGGSSTAHEPGTTPSPGVGPSSLHPGAYPPTPGSHLTASVTAIPPSPAAHSLRQRASSIRLRRVPSNQPLHQIRRKPVPVSTSSDNFGPTQETTGSDNRRRSSSEPQRPSLQMLEGVGLDRQRTADHMATIQENAPPVQPNQDVLVIPQPGADPNRRALLIPRFLRRRPAGEQPSQPQLNQEQVAQALAGKPVMPGAFPGEYDSGIVDLLDLVDPEVSTLSTLTNVQNSLFVPSLGRFLNRRPTYDLSPRDMRADTDTTESSESDSDEEPGSPTKIRPPPSPDADGIRQTTQLQRQASIKSVLDDSHYAVLPHGVSLEGWTEDDKRALDDHVRHFLHSRRSKFKRGMKGFLKYIQKPLGFLVTLYAFLITVFGLIWVLMLIGWISGGNTDRHKYLINIVDNVLVALFAVVGDGLAPFRTVDTYHMIFIAHYAHLTWKLREEKKLPELDNQNDLPEARVTDGDLEAAKLEKAEYSVLTPAQQLRLEHHQEKFSNSHTFYKPHETTTHYAFSVKLLIAIVVLLDMHSILQITLGGLTWGIDYRHRSQIPTTVVLCCSITCNITAGILISIGDRRSRKKDVIEKMFRQTLTEEAMKKVKKHKKHERKKAEAEKKETEKLEHVAASALPGIA